VGEEKAVATNNMSLDERNKLAASLGAKFLNQIMASFGGGGESSSSEADEAENNKIFKAPDVTYPSIASAS